MGKAVFGPRSKAVRIGKRVDHASHKKVQSRLGLIMSEKPPEFDLSDPWKREREITCGALIGLALISIVEMLGLPALDIPLKMSVFSFAISIPVLSAVILCMTNDSVFNLKPHGEGIHLAWFFGVFMSFLGISGLFFHLSLFAGILFVVLSLTGLCITVRYATK